MKNNLILKERIEVENLVFLNMNKNEKIVRIAEDCIERIQLNQIIASKGNVVMFNHYFKPNNDLKNIVNDGVTCSACAKGGLFLSYVGRVNNFSYGDLQGNNSLYDNEHSKLLEIFSIEQLALIEAAFEGKQCLHSVSLRGKVRKYRAFFRKHGGTYDSYQGKIDFDVAESTDENSNKRLIAICENIIENKGTFVL
jgi:hypothetical protein